MQTDRNATRAAVLLLCCRIKLEREKAGPSTPREEEEEEEAGGRERQRQ